MSEKGCQHPDGWTERGCWPHGREHVWYECWLCGEQRDPHSCGYLEDSFACRIRHVSINTGWAKKYH